MDTFFFPGMFTHAHRSHEKRLEMEYTFDRIGLHPVAEYNPECKATFVGDHSVLSPPIMEQIAGSGKPVVCYVWDLYEWNVHGVAHGYWLNWINYLKHKTARILVPGKSTAKRVQEYVGRDDSVVVKAPVHLWERPPGECPSAFKNTVVDVMRPYGDPNENVVLQACRELNIPCTAAKTRLDWDDFRHAVCNAKVLVSAYKEASTGGLTLIEGYWFGRPSLCSNSPYNGVSEYMGDKAEYFQWDDYNDLKSKIQQLYEAVYIPELEEDRHRWVVDNYRPDLFVRKVAQIIRELL